MLEENREGCEGGCDTHTLKDSLRLQQMKALQDLRQGSREDLGEAAGHWGQCLTLSSCHKIQLRPDFLLLLEAAKG